jgi:hypothetical protein
MPQCIRARLEGQPFAIFLLLLYLKGSCLAIHRSLRGRWQFGYVRGNSTAGAPVLGQRMMHSATLGSL